MMEQLDLSMYVWEGESGEAKVILGQSSDYKSKQVKSNNLGYVNEHICDGSVWGFIDSVSSQ